MGDRLPRGGQRPVRPVGRQPGRPALHQVHPDRRRPGRPRLGTCIHPRRAAAPVPPHRVDAGLVRRVPRLLLLHGGPDAAGGGGGRRPGHAAPGGRASRHRPGSGTPAAQPVHRLDHPAGPAGCGHRAGGARPLRHGAEVGDDRWPGGHAGGRMADGAPGRSALPRPGADRRGHPAVRVRPVVQHHGRQPDVDHGRRVRLHAGRGGLPRLHRPHGPGPRDRPGSGRCRSDAGPHRVVPPARGVLRTGGIGGCPGHATEP